jgi:hypothetical protein
MRTTVMGIGLIFAAATLAPSAGVQAQDRRHGGDEAVECSSQDFKRERCDVPWRDARLERQLSDTRCVRGQNWGIDRHGLWVDRGCSGRFVSADDRGHGRDRDRHDYGRDNDRADAGGWQPDPSWNQRFTVACESQDGQNHFCAVDLGGAGRASLARQLSQTRCVEGENWGSNRAGVWVSAGCRGVFTIDRRWR